MEDLQIKVGMFTNALARGGAEEHVLTLLRGFDRRLLRLFLICPAPLLELLAEDLPKDVTAVPIEFRSLTDVRATLGLTEFLRRERLDIVHSHLFYSSLFASPVARMCGVPGIVETPHVSERWRKGWKSSFFVDRAAGKCVDRYIAVSDANRRYLIETKGLPAEKIEVIHNGSDLCRFDPVHKGPASMKAELGLKEADRILLIVGRLEPQKGHKIALAALSELVRDFPETRLICLGDGALRGELEAQANQLGLRDAVRFVGFQSNVPDWLALADIVVLPSFFEGLPLAAIEALAAARPIVATAVDGTPEVVVDGQTGLLVPPGDSVTLAGAIARLLRDPDLAEKLSRAGRMLVEQHFTEEHQVRATEELYFRLLKRPYPARVPLHVETC